MRRAVKVSLKHITEKKRRQIAALLEAYRGAVNFYIRSLWKNPGGLNKEILARLENTRLSERYKSQALKQALEIVTATKKSAKAKKRKASVPKFKGGMVLDAKFVTIEQGRNSFGWWLKLSTLKKGRRIWIPFKGTKVLDKWLSYKGAQLVQGCCISEKEDALDLTLWVEMPSMDPKSGETKGVDIGLNKMLTFSDGTWIGEEFSEVVRKVKRRVPGSKGKAEAIRERDNFINRMLNQIPWEVLGVLVVEALKNLKHGKKPNRSKAFRRALSPWTYAQVLRRLEHKAQENRVLLIAVPPAYTSQICPRCTHVDKANRKDEVFRCVRCGYSNDADVVGALNILSRGLRSAESLSTAKSMA